MLPVVVVCCFNINIVTIIKYTWSLLILVLLTWADVFVCAMLSLFGYRRNRHIMIVVVVVVVVVIMI